jgi:hypothetical protein
LSGIEDFAANRSANAAISGLAGLAAGSLVSFLSIGEIAAGPVGWTVGIVTDTILGILDLSDSICSAAAAAPP